MNSNQSLSYMKVLCNWETLCARIKVTRLQSSGLRLKHEILLPYQNYTWHKNYVMVFHKFIKCMWHGTIMEDISTHSQNWQKFICLTSGLNSTAHTFWVLGIRVVFNWDASVHFWNIRTFWLKVVHKELILKNLF